MTARIDTHRPGAIIPANYRIVLSYNLATTQDNWPVPSWRINCELDGRQEIRDNDGKHVRVENGKHADDGRCCVIGLRSIARVTWGGRWNSAGKCSVCGAAFVYGDVWEHIPTGEHIHVGHICADKYELLADRSAYELELGHLKEAAARALTRARNDKERAAFLQANPGLSEALALKDRHNILADFARKFTEYRSLSEAQVRLALKIAHKLNNPEVAERNAPAPVSTGPKDRKTFRGIVVSVKEGTGLFGGWKVTVKVQGEGGVWLANGTLPAAIADAGRSQGLTPRALRGATVEVTALLNPGRDAHFVFMGRPVGTLIAPLPLSPTPRKVP